MRFAKRSLAESKVGNPLLMRRLTAIMLAAIMVACAPALAADSGVYTRILEQIRQGRSAEAERELLAIAGERPSDPEALFYLGTLRATRQDWAAAIAYYLKALALGPRNGRILRALGYAYIDAGNFVEAAAALQSSVALERDAAAYFTLGAILKRQEQNESAKQALRDGLAIEPGNMEARLMLADALLATSDFAGARAEYARVAQAEPANTHAQLGLAKVSMLVPGRAAEAESALLSVLRREPRHFDSRFQLAQLYERTGRDREAASELAVALEIEPRSAPALLLASKVLARLGLTAESKARREQFQEIIRSEDRLQEDRLRAAQLVQAAKDLAHANRLAEAANALEEALRLDPGSARAHVQYAKVLISKGARSRALDQIQAAIRSLIARSERRTI